MRVVVASFAILAIQVVVVGCTMPSTTRSAIVQDVKIAEDLSPTNLRVHPGDEIRWVNLRKDRVQIDIPNLGEKNLACKRGFANWLGATKETVRVEPNDTVSLCFGEPSLVEYIVRVDSALRGGKQILQGSVNIADSR